MIHALPGVLYAILWASGWFTPLQELTINEIYFAPPESNLEFIEILNTSAEPLNLCQFSFSDSREEILTICEGRLDIPPSGFAVLARDGQALAEAFPGVASITPSEWPALNNSGDTVRLLIGGEVIEEVSYLGSWGVRDVSLERRDPAGPPDRSFNWGASLDPDGGTPGEENSLFSPDRVPPRPILAEVQDPGTVFLAWNEPVDTDGVAPSSFRIQQQEPGSVSILSDSTMTLTFSGEITGQELLTRGVTDLANNASTAVSIPLAYVPETNDLAITEIMYEPLRDDFDQIPNQPEYVEIFNTTDRSLSLRSLSMSGEPDESGRSDELNPEPGYYVLSPQSFGIFVAIPDDKRLDRILQDAFPSIIPFMPTLTLLRVPGSGLGLSNTGDYICLSLSRAYCVTEVAFSPSWHHPALASTRGIALERRSVHADGHLASNWTSSVAPDGGTPGQANSIYFPIDTEFSSESVTLSPTPFSPDGDGIHDVLGITISVATAPKSIRISIFDTSGRPIKTLVPAAMIGIEAAFFWDGTNDRGESMPVGMYVVFVELLDIIQGTVLNVKKVAVLARPLH